MSATYLIEIFLETTEDSAHETRDKLVRFMETEGIPFTTTWVDEVPQ